MFIFLVIEIPLMDSLENINQNIDLENVCTVFLDFLLLLSK